MTNQTAQAEARSTREEALARLEKAHAIITFLEANVPDMTAEIATVLDPSGRNAAALLAGQRPPSDKTWAIVVRHYEAKTSDPFEGLPR